MTKVLVIHGPNLNLLGDREKSIYGEMTLADINKSICDEAGKLSISVEAFQSNHEGEIVQKIQDAKLIVKEGKLLAFYIPSLGEGPIISKNENAGIELMKLKHAQSEYAVLPQQNKPGIDFLEANDFKRIDKTGTRMQRGPRLKWKPENIFSRIGGNYG